MVYKKLFLFFLTFNVITAEARAENYLFATYRLSNHGTASHIGLAGATLALPQCDMAAFENPASVTFQDALVIGTGAFGTSQTNAPDLSTLSHKQQKDLTFSVTAHPLGFLAFALGVQLESQDNSRPLNSKTSTGTKVSETKIPISFSIKPFDQFSLGISYVSLMSSVERTAGDNSSANNSTAVQKFSGSAWKLSMIYAISENFSFAMSHQGEAILNQSSQTGGTVATVSHAYSPAEEHIGVAYLKPLMGEPAFFQPVDLLFSLPVLLPNVIVHHLIYPNVKRNWWEGIIPNTAVLNSPSTCLRNTLTCLFRQLLFPRFTLVDIIFRL